MKESTVPGTQSDLPAYGLDTNAWLSYVKAEWNKWREVLTFQYDKFII